MRRKWIAAAVLAALLLTALFSALAAGSSQSDPLVTLNYLTGTYYSQAEQAMAQQAQKGTVQVEKDTFDRLEQLADSYLAQAGGGDYAAAFTRLSLSRGDQLDLSAGASLLFENGTADLSFQQGALVDVTVGTLVIPGGTVSPGHRYVAAEDTSCSLTAVSDAVYLSVQGRYSLIRTGSSSTPFTDLSSSDWYYSAVCFAYENGLFKGLSETLFSPGTNMNRAMLATVLCRLAGAEGASVPSAGFSDVASSAWYADAVNWAAQAGIVNGMGDGTFAPDESVTREQMASMLYRYAKDYRGMAVAPSGILEGFSDHTAISSWAQEAVSWAVGCGIMNGYNDGTLGPARTASRAEVAAMLQRFSALLS